MWMAHTTPRHPSCGRHWSGLAVRRAGQALRVEKIANNPIRSEDRAGVRFISVSVSSLGCGNNTDNLTIHERSQFIDRIVTLFVSSDEHPRRRMKPSFQTDVYLCGIAASVSFPKLRPFCLRGFAAADEPHLGPISVPRVICTLGREVLDQSYCNQSDRGVGNI